MNRIIMFQSRLQGSLFVMRKYGDVLGADQTESGIWVREIDHIHYRKRKLVTLRLRCENVSNRLNISRTKKKKSWPRTLWETCDSLRMFRWWYELSDAAKAAVIGRLFWRWTLPQYVVTKFKQFNFFSISGYNVSQHHWEAVSNSRRICCQIWLYINYEAEGGYHFYLGSVTSFLMFSVSLDEGRNGRRDWSIIDVFWGRA